MGQYFGGTEYTGPPFQLFGAAHLAMLVVIGLSVWSVIHFSLRADAAQRQRIRYWLAAIMLTSELLWHIWTASVGWWSVQTMLPLHLCSMLVLLSAVMLTTKNLYLYEIVYFMGIGAALQVLITPDAGMFGFPHFRFFQPFISHGLLLLAPLYMTIVEKFRPTWMSVLRVIIIANLYMLFVGGINYLLGSNYLFIARKPGTASLIDLMGPWPQYILWMEVAGIVMILLLYLPFAIKDYAMKNRHREG